MPVVSKNQQYALKRSISLNPKSAPKYYPTNEWLISTCNDMDSLGNYAGSIYNAISAKDLARLTSHELTYYLVDRGLACVWGRALNGCF